MTDTVIWFAVGGILTAAYLLIENHMKQNEPLVGGGVVLPTGPKRKGVIRYIILCFIFWMFGVAGIAVAGIYYSGYPINSLSWNPGVAFASILGVIANAVLGVRFLILSEENRCYNERKEL